MSTTMICIRWFDDISIADVATVGGKNASLGEMRGSLNPDSLLKTMVAIVEAERALAERGAASGEVPTETPDATPSAKQPAVTEAHR
jgi:hypothetical protein